MIRILFALILVTACSKEQTPVSEIKPMYKKSSAKPVPVVTPKPVESSKDAVNETPKEPVKVETSVPEQVIEHPKMEGMDLNQNLPEPKGSPEDLPQSGVSADAKTDSVIVEPKGLPEDLPKMEGYDEKGPERALL